MNAIVSEALDHHDKVESVLEHPLRWTPPLPIALVDTTAYMKWSPDLYSLKEDALKWGHHNSVSDAEGLESCKIHRAASGVSSPEASNW